MEGDTSNFIWENLFISSALWHTDVFLFIYLLFYCSRKTSVNAGTKQPTELDGSIHKVTCHPLSDLGVSLWSGKTVTATSKWCNWVEPEQLQHICLHATVNLMFCRGINVLRPLSQHQGLVQIKGWNYLKVWIKLIVFKGRLQAAQGLHLSSFHIQLHPEASLDDPCVVCVQHASVQHVCKKEQQSSRLKSSFSMLNGKFHLLIWVKTSSSVRRENHHFVFDLRDKGAAAHPSRGWDD